MVRWPQAEKDLPGYGENAVASRIWKGEYK